MQPQLRMLTDGIVFGEGPRWHEGRLFFSDIRGHCVEAVGMDGRRETVARLAGEPSGLGWLPDGRMHWQAAGLLERLASEDRTLAQWEEARVRERLIV